MKLAIKYDLLILLALLLIMNIPFLAGSTPVDWDTFNIYEEFSITYNAVYFDNQLPLWLPFSSYGIPDYGNLGGLSIFSYLFIYMGKLFQFQNILWLFKFSLFCEQLISVFGMYLLTSQLFHKKTSVLISCIALMTTFALYRQVQLNFRVIYLLPLILYWIVLFFERKSSVFIWLTGLTILFTVPGNSFYPIVIAIYGAAVFALVLFLYDRKSIKYILGQSKTSLLILGCFLVIALLFSYYFLTFNDGVTVMREGRDANLVVQISNFLHNWKLWNPLDIYISLLFAFVSNNISNGYEYIFYIGLLPLVGVVVSLFFQRRPAWFASLSAAIFLYLFSLGGIFTFAAFFLPLVNLTRYIAILGTIPFRFFLILVGGFGLDMDLSIQQWKKVFLSIIGFVLITEIIIAFSSPESATGYFDILNNPDTYTLDVKLFIARLVILIVLFISVYLLFRFNKEKSNKRIETRSLISVGFIIFALIDAGLFRVNYERKIGTYLSDLKGQTLLLPTLSPLVYQDQRLIEPLDENTKSILNGVIPYQANNGTNIILESFIKFDQCLPTFVKMGNEFELFTFSLNPLFENELTLLPNKEIGNGINQIYGCEYPKLRVVSNLQVAATNEDALSLMKNTTDFSNLLILSQEYSQKKTSLDNPVPDATINVTGFAHNEIQIEVDLQQENGWLIYSDTYHNEWHAKINGDTQNIERAYLAFKALPLTQGKNSIIMTYGSPLKHFCYNLLAILSGFAALILLIGFFIVLFSIHRLERKGKRK